MKKSKTKMSLKFLKLKKMWRKLTKLKKKWSLNILICR